MQVKETQRDCNWKFRQRIRQHRDVSRRICDNINVQRAWETDIVENRKFINFKLGCGVDDSVTAREICQAMPEHRPFAKANRNFMVPVVNSWNAEENSRLSSTTKGNRKKWKSCNRRPLPSRQCCNALRVITKVAEIQSTSDKQTHLQKPPHAIQRSWKSQRQIRDQNRSWCPSHST